MLVLQRRIGQSIAIGEDTEIVVTKIKGHAVSLGIHAPRNVTVDRGEIHLRRLTEQVSADEERSVFAGAGSAQRKTPVG